MKEKKIMFALPYGTTMVSAKHDLDTIATCPRGWFFHKLGYGMGWYRMSVMWMAIKPNQVKMSRAK